jgi:hypothetical protein
VIGRSVAVVAVVLAGLCLVGCDPGGGASQSPTAPSGIRGTVFLGPTCPGPVDPSATDEPCVTPYTAQLAILDADGKVVTRVTSGADGTFQVDLPPGDYTVAPQNGDPVPSAPSQPVSVEPGKYTEIQVNYDSGIR